MLLRPSRHETDASSNIRSRHPSRFASRFAVAPASSLQLAYQLTKRAAAFVGYDFLYITSVVRPGDNIDRVLTPAGLPLPSGPGIATARPGGGINSTDFYANAVSFGLKFQY